MTITTDTRTEFTPTTPGYPPIGSIAPGEPEYVANPHRFSTIASGVLDLVAIAGTAWSLLHGYAHAPLSFVLVLVMTAVFVVNLNRFNAWDRG